MRVRAAMTAVAICATIAAPALTTAHTKKEACHGKGRVVKTFDVGGTIFYTDDRGFVDHDTAPDEAHDAYKSLPPEVKSTLGYGRIPTVAADDDVGGFWIYMESNGHPGLQTGGEHAVLGANDDSAIDPCRNTHGVANGYDAILF